MNARIVAVRYRMLGFACMLGCTLGCSSPRSETNVSPQTDPATPLLSTNPDDNPLTLADDPSRSAAPSFRVDVTVSALHVRVPRTSRGELEPIWNFVREDALPAGTALRLRKNGLRVGIGRDEAWDAIQTTLDTLPGIRSVNVPPLRLPANYPLALELDTAARTQTLFYVGDDDVLTGETWPESRNVLRLSYGLDLMNPSRVQFVVVPEVRQHLAGMKWITTDLGVTQVPNYAGRAFGAAGFVVPIATGEFILVAPSEEAQVAGLVGGAFLTFDEEGQRYDAVVFVRADVNHVTQRN